VRRVIGHYNDVIQVNGKETKISASVYESTAGLKEWDGTGILDFSIAIKLLGIQIKTEIGAIIITNCTKDNNICFSGAGKPSFV